MTMPTGINPTLPKPTGLAGRSNGAVATLSFAGKVFRFRTNPNEVWWSYELLKNVEYTYGGQVIQLLGVRLGDLRVKIECGWGGWDYLVQVAMFLRQILEDQRGGNTATFTYPSRGWQLNVYGMSIPFADQLTATTREIELVFKIQEDVNGTLSQVTLNADIARLAEGVYLPSLALPHNQYDDQQGLAGNLDGMSSGMLSDLYNSVLHDPQTPSGPTYAPIGITNNVDMDILGNLSDLLGNPLSDLTDGLNLQAPSLPGIGKLPIG